MAANDLMMRIQLLLQGGRSSAELKRLQAQLKTLTDSLSSLERTKIDGLTGNLQALGRAGRSLKGTDLSNFATDLTTLRGELTRLGASTSNIDRLRTAFRDLSTGQADASRKIADFKRQINDVGNSLKNARQYSLTGFAGQPMKERIRELNEVNNRLKDNQKELIKEAKSIAVLNKQLKDSVKLYNQQRQAQGQASGGILRQNLAQDLQRLTLEQTALKNAERNLKGLKEQLQGVRQEASKLSRTKILADGLSGGANAAQINQAAQAYKRQNDELAKQKTLLRDLRSQDPLKRIPTVVADYERDRQALTAQRNLIADTTQKLKRLEQQRRQALVPLQSEVQSIANLSQRRKNLNSVLDSQKQSYKDTEQAALGLRNELRQAQAVNLSSLLTPISQAKTNLDSAKQSLEGFRNTALSARDSIRTAGIIDPGSLRSAIDGWEKSRAATQAAKDAVNRTQSAIRNLKSDIASIRPQGIDSINAALLKARTNLDASRKNLLDYRNQLNKLRDDQRLAKSLQLPDQSQQLQQLRSYQQGLKDNAGEALRLKSVLQDLRFGKVTGDSITDGKLAGGMRGMTDSARLLNTEIANLQNKLRNIKLDPSAFKGLNFQQLAQSSGLDKIINPNLLRPAIQSWGDYRQQVAAWTQQVRQGQTAVISLKQQISDIRGVRATPFGPEMLKGLTDVQNKIREINASNGIQKALRVDKPNAQVKLYDAEINALEKLGKAYKRKEKLAEEGDKKGAEAQQKRILAQRKEIQSVLGGDITAYDNKAKVAERIAKIEAKSAIDRLKAAKASQEITNNTGERLAQLRQIDATGKSEIARLQQQIQQQGILNQGYQNAKQLLGDLGKSARDNVKAATEGVQQEINTRRQQLAQVKQAAEGIKGLLAARGLEGRAIQQNIKNLLSEGKSRAESYAGGINGLRQLIGLENKLSASARKGIIDNQTRKRAAQDIAESARNSLRQQLSGFVQTAKAARDQLNIERSSEAVAKGRIQSLRDAAKVAVESAKQSASAANLDVQAARNAVAARKTELSSAQDALRSAKDLQSQRVASIRTQLAQQEVDKANARAAVSATKERVNALDNQIKVEEAQGKIRAKSLDDQIRAQRILLGSQGLDRGEIARRVASSEAVITAEKNKQARSIQDTIRQRDIEADRLVSAKRNLDGLIAAERQANLQSQLGLQQRIQGQQTYTAGLKSGVDAIKAAVQADKQALVGYREGQKAFANQIREQINSAKERVRSGQISRQELTAERAAIQEGIKAQKEASRAYQARLSEQRTALQEAIRGESARVKSLQDTVSQLKRATGADIERQRVAAQSQLGSAKQDRTSLRNQVRDTENLAKAEIQRIRSLEDSSRAIGRQRGELTTLGRLFRGNTGIVREFGAALRFALGPQMIGFAAAGGILQMFGGFAQANKEIENLTRGLNALTGGNADLYFNELVTAANSTGQSLHAVTDSYLQLVAASKGTRLEGAATREIFQSVSQALVITGADAVRSKRAFLALAQMMSKGQIFAEELRQQLSEALPGAVQIFARALKITPQEMFNLMQQGKISSEALLLFAQQIQQEMPALSEDLFTFTQKSALLQNSVRLLFKEIGDTGIWDAFGDGLLKARNLVDSFRSNIGGLSDSIKREFRFSSELFEISGVGSVLGGAFEGLVGLVSEIVQRAASILEELPMIAARVAVSTRNAIEQVVVALGGEDLVDNAKGLFKFLSTKSDEFNRDFRNKFSLVFQAGIGGLSDGFSGFLEGGINNRIRDAEENLSRLLSVTRLTQEEFKNLSESGISISQDSIANNGLRKNIESFGEYNALYGEALAKAKEELRLAKERLAIFEKQNKAANERNNNLDQAGKDNKFIELFDPKARQVFNELRSATIDLQRSQEDILRVSQENERSKINVIHQTKSIWGIERDILNTIRRAKEVEAERIGDRNKDAMDSLRLEQDRFQAIEQSKKNAKDLGFGYDPERSKQEFRAYQLRQQAQKELQAAARATNAEEKKGALERAQYLTEESNQLYLQAGRTYALGQGYDQIKKIQEQLSAVKQREVADALKLTEYAEAESRAKEAYANATDLTLNLTGAERVEWAKIADDLLQIQRTQALELGFGEQAKEAEKLRKTLDQILSENVGKIEKLVNQSLGDRVQVSIEEFKASFELFEKSRADMLALRADLLAQGAGDEGASQSLKNSLDDINRAITREDERLRALRTNWADALYSGRTDLPDVVFPVLLAEMKPEELQKIQDAADQRKIEIETGIKVPTEPVKVELQPVTQEEAKTFLQNVKEVWNDIFKMPPAYKQEPDLGFDNEAATSYFDNFRLINKELVTASTNTDALREANFRNNQAAEQYKPQIEKAQQAVQGFRKELDSLKGTPAQAIIPDVAPVLQSFNLIDVAANHSAAQTKELFDILSQPVRSQVFLDFPQIGRLQFLQNLLKELESTQPQISVGAIADTDQMRFVKELIVREYKEVPALIKPTLDQAAAQQAQASISNTIKAIPVNLLPPITVGITPDLDQAKVAEQSQALRTAFQQQGVTINVDVVADKNEITGVEKTLNRLTATDRRVEISARTELLDRSMRDIDSQFQELNRTAGAGIQRGFQRSGADAQQFGALVDQVNLKMRETARIAGLADTEVESLLAERKDIELQIKVDRSEADKIAEDFHRETQEKLKDPDPITFHINPSQMVEAQRLIGEVQSDLQKLKDAGATNIEVRFDEKAGKLIITADTSQAETSANAIISRINSSEAVLKVKIKVVNPNAIRQATRGAANVPGFRSGGPISGYGGGDKVRALLEPGEFVLRKEAARALGLERLMKLNRMGHQALSSFKTPRMDASHIHVPRFAEGGAVGGQPIIINVPGSQPIRVSGSRDQATALANLLARTGRAL